MTRPLALLPSLLLVAAAAPAQDRDPGRLVVLLKSEAAAQVVDLADGATLARIPTGVGPHEVLVLPGARRAVVANYGGRTAGATLTVLDLRRDRALRTVDLGEPARPHGLAVTPTTGELWVTAEERRSLLRLDPVDWVVREEVALPRRLGHMVASDDDGRLYVSHLADGGVTRVRAEAGPPLPDGRPVLHYVSDRFVATGAGSEGLAWDPVHGLLWVTDREADDVVALDPEDLSVRHRLEAEGFPIRAAVTPDGSRLLVSCARAGVLRAFDLTGDAPEAAGVLDFGALARGDGSERLFGSTMGDSPTPIGIALSADGERAYVSLAHADRVAEVAVSDLVVLRTFATGREPDGIAWYPSPRE